jgi:chromosome segregation ATPase
MTMARTVEAEPVEQEDRPKRNLVWIIILGLLWLVFSGLSIYYWNQKETLKEEKAQVEKLKSDLDKEIAQLQQTLDGRNSDLMAKDNTIKDLSMKLQQAETIKMELDRMRALSSKESKSYGATLAALKQKEMMIDSLMIAQTQTGTTISGLEAKSAEKDKTIQKLQDEQKELKSEIVDQSERIANLEKKLDNVYMAYDFNFFDDKNEFQLQLKRNAIRKKSFSITFKVAKHDRSPAHKTIPNLSAVIRGIKMKKGSFSKEFPIKEHPAGMAKLVITQQTLPAGIYQIRIRQKDKELGDASFMVR